jgi:uncharacterized protein YheU (UPF0270 family)
MSNIEIPWQQLSGEALQGVIEEFITREGTDYGTVETALADKVEQVMAQLRRGEAVLLFDAERSRSHIVLQRDFQVGSQ